MKKRSTTTDPQTSNTPTCWQRDAPAACLRVELPSGEVHLFSYQHFVTASLQRDDTGVETLRITFSCHEVDVTGRGLREFLYGLQDFAMKWVRVAPERYWDVPLARESLVTELRITSVE